MVWEGQVPQNTLHAQVLGHAYLMNYLRIGCYLDDTWMLLGWYFSTCQFSQSNIHLRIPFSRDIAQSLTAARNRWKMDHGNMVFFFASFLSNVHNSYAIPWYWLLYRDPDAGLLFPIYSLAFIVYQVTGYHNILWENPDKNTEARSFLAVFSIKSILQNAHCKAQWTYIQITSIWRLSFQIYFSEICQATSKMWNP